MLRDIYTTPALPHLEFLWMIPLEQIGDSFNIIKIFNVTLK